MKRKSKRAIINTKREKSTVTIKKADNENTSVLVKQELFDTDTKHSLALAGNSTATVIAGSSSSLASVEDSLIFKQEARKSDTFPKRSPGPKTYRLIACYFCRLCDQEMEDLESVRRHRLAEHSIKYPERSKIKHMDCTPNVYNPELYCKACEMTSKSLQKYRKHLQQTHFMKLPASLLIGPKNDSIPDVNDPNFYCSSCEKKYKSTGYYRSHLLRQHRIRTVVQKRGIKNPDMLPELDDPNNYCRACEKSYKSKATFKIHNSMVHKMKMPKPTFVDHENSNFECNICSVAFISDRVLRLHCRYFHPTTRSFFKKQKTNIVPDISDPNNYCKTCKKKFSRKHAYRLHLTFVHRMLGPPPLPRKGETPTGPSKGYHCRVCDKTLPTKYTFQRHNYFIHSKQEQQVDIKDQPDINDPGACSVCKTTFASTKSYHQHLRNIHLILLKPLQKQRNLNSQPDHLDPNFFCRICNKKFKNLSTYQNHCRVVHKMNMGYGKAPKYGPGLNCSRCNKCLSTINKLKIHWKQVHKMEPPTTINNTVKSEAANLDVDYVNHE